MKIPKYICNRCGAVAKPGTRALEALKNLQPGDRPPRIIHECPSTGTRSRIGWAYAVTEQATP